MIYQFADLNGVAMHYDLQGSGPGLVLLHAGIAHLGMWDAQMAAFTKQFEVLRYDIRGWGKTLDPAGEYTEHGDLKALMQHVGLGKANILGISNGGRIAIDFAIAFPEMVEKLVLVAPALGGFDYPDDSFVDKFEEKLEAAMQVGDLETAAEYEALIWVDGPRRKPEDLEQGFRKRALGLIKETLAIPEGEGKGSMLAPKAAGRLDEILAKCLVIIGDKDVDSLRAVVGHLVAHISDIHRVDMEGVAHLPNMENPNSFNEIVLDFLTE